MQHWISTSYTSFNSQSMWQFSMQQRSKHPFFFFFFFGKHTYLVCSLLPGSMLEEEGQACSQVMESTWVSQQHSCIASIHCLRALALSQKKRLQGKSWEADVVGSSTAAQHAWEADTQSAECCSWSEAEQLLSPFGYSTKTGSAPPRCLQMQVCSLSACA